MKEMIPPKKAVWCQKGAKLRVTFSWKTVAHVISKFWLLKNRNALVYAQHMREYHRREDRSPH